MSFSYGRAIRAIPGPSMIPDRVLNAMHQAAPNIYEGELVELTGTVRSDLRRVARTEGAVAIYIGNGHAMWEASLANMARPGERILVLLTGRFGRGWAETARRLGIEVETIDFGFRGAVEPGRIEDHLRADADRRIRAVLTTQTDTASSALTDIRAVRAAIDAAGHPALLAVDCVASLAADRFEMDAWGVDVMISACQKGLMTPPGLGFTFQSDKAMAEGVPCPSPYWDWRPRSKPGLFYELFHGTAPTHHLFGLREALDMILLEEGLGNVWARHAVFARAVAAAVEAWGRAGALELNIPAAPARSYAVTTIRTGPGEAGRIRAWCEEIAGVTLGIGLETPGVDPSSMFRIAHMGHLNPPTLLGTLATVETALDALGIAHGPGAVEAASRVIAAADRERARGGAESVERRIAIG
ncbi:pyridoxal-phosphate-dependent aminotransferase family protein [Amaricoccus solimangrovi]|uniref:Alanine--glyoxylate aminotransferase family protein n=1 Tax=Amaricoccus solimangrovi TaxID=2589815 RepID=A0A501WL56_9RHOB|nr:aminotransferase class V-fold PLP-dependent enzyme [Amaricoccus solimangrovi]TPE47947.1 alanine--glyoxylate aminotransferase family protein [Amaricoccus solimangrovi]